MLHRIPCRMLVVIAIFGSILLPCIRAVEPTETVAQRLQGRSAGSAGRGIGLSSAEHIARFSGLLRRTLRASGSRLEHPHRAREAHEPYSRIASRRHHESAFQPVGQRANDSKCQEQGPFHWTSRVSCQSCCKCAGSSSGTPRPEDRRPGAPRSSRIACGPDTMDATGVMGTPSENEPAGRRPAQVVALMAPV